MSDDEDPMREFMLESSESLNQLDRDFVALEQNPTDRALIGAIFRSVHTIKGTCGFFGLSRLETLTHAGEAVLCSLRDGAVVNDTDITSALLAMVDAVRRIITSLETRGVEGDEDHRPLIAELDRLRLERRKEPPAEPASPLAPSKPVVALPALAPEPSAPSASSGNASTSEPTNESNPSRGSVIDSAIRVDVVLLDKVMNLVGELVLARNQILQYGASSEDQGFVKASQRLNLLTTELQEGVMKTRMQPIANVWNKFPRVVRDLAQACHKRVDLVLDGAETELDRTIIEAIKDPLTHAVRNAVDHGIENPQKRLAAGKKDTGTLTLRAFHEGGQVNIEVSDDGGGLEIERIRARAVERGIVTADRALRMNDREVGLFIFHPGFSTAESVTNVSGRGVGMDVVKTNIEKIGGTVDLSSRPGHGTTLKIKIPLTLAIIPALIVTSATAEQDGFVMVTHRFAIPQVNLLELVRLDGPNAMKSIERLHGTTIYRSRGNLLPLVFLTQTLELEPAPAEDDVMNIVVLQADDRQFGLVVDGILDTEEIVVKPLGKELKGITTFAGATIMGDGRVALILDVLGIAQRANVVSAGRERNSVDHDARKEQAGDGREALLLFRVGETGRMAIPLAMVARLEEISVDKVEKAAGRDVVQYRGEILQLIDLGARRKEGGRSEPLQVIVYSELGRSVGLVVDQIIDVVEEKITVQSRTARDGVIGAAVVQGQVTDLLDVRGVIERADPNFFGRSDAA